MKKVIFTVILALALCVGLSGQGKKITELPLVVSASDASLLMVRSGASGNTISAITLANLLSNIQTQINAKASLASPTFTGTVTLPATTSIGDVDATEISYLDNATSNIQDQLNDTVDLESISIDISTIDIDDDVITTKELGSVVKFEPVYCDAGMASYNLSLTDEWLIASAVHIRYASVITGVKYVLGAAGNYNQDKTNGVALYKKRDGSPICDLVAQTANDSTFLCITATTYGSIDFTAPYTAAEGIYYIAYLYNCKGTATKTPGIYGAPINYVRPVVTTYPLAGILYNTSTFAATLDISAFSQSTSIVTWFGLY